MFGVTILIILLGVLGGIIFLDLRNNPKRVRKLVARIASDLKTAVRGSKEEWTNVFVITDYILAANLPYSIIVSPLGKTSLYIDRLLVENLNWAEQIKLKEALRYHLKQRSLLHDWETKMKGIKIMETPPSYKNPEPSFPADHDDEVVSSESN